MVQHNDLRIGNLVYLDGEIVRVEFIDIKEDYSGVQPIPLTPEILEKAAVEINRFNQYDFVLYERAESYKVLSLDLKQGYLWLKDGRKMDDAIICLWNRDYNKDIYLHQLQNFFYVLSGYKELEINL